MTSNEEIYYLTHKYKKVCIPWGYTISNIKNWQRKNKTKESEVKNVTK